MFIVGVEFSTPNIREILHIILKKSSGSDDITSSLITLAFKLIDSGPSPKCSESPTSIGEWILKVLLRKEPVITKQVLEQLLSRVMSNTPSIQNVTNLISEIATTNQGIMTLYIANQ
jgi:hypothetical protein